MGKFFKRFSAVLLAVMMVFGGIGAIGATAATTTDLSNYMELSYGELAATLGLEKVHWFHGNVYPFYYSDFSDTEIGTVNRGAAEVRWSDSAISFYGIKPGDAFNISALNAKLVPQGFEGVIAGYYDGPGSGDYIARRVYNATVSFNVSGGIITDMGLLYRSINEEFGQNAALTFDTKGGAPIAKYIVMGGHIFPGVHITVELPSAIRAGHTFLGWSESPSATSVDYQAGSDYALIASNTLYAVWGTASINKDALNALVHQVGGMTGTNYTNESWAALLDAFYAAQSTALDANATQAQIESAYNALSAALDNLQLRSDPIGNIFGTKYAATPLNWFLFIVCFGWIWFWFL